MKKGIELRVDTLADKPFSEYPTTNLRFLCNSIVAYLYPTLEILCEEFKRNLHHGYYQVQDTHGDIIFSITFHDASIGTQNDGLGLFIVDVDSLLRPEAKIFLMPMLLAHIFNAFPKIEYVTLSRNIDLNLKYFLSGIFEVDDHFITVRRKWLNVLDLPTRSKTTNS